MEVIKMNQKRKLTSLLLMLSLVFGLFAGCDTSESPAAGQETQSAQPAQPTSVTADEKPEETDSGTAVTSVINYPLAEETVTLSMWTRVNVTASTNFETYSDHHVYATAEELTNVHINFSEVSSESETAQFGLMLASDDYADIISNFTGLYSGADNAIEEGIIVDIYPYMEENSPEYFTLINAPEVLRDMMTDSGRIPAFRGIYSELSMGENGLVIRKDWLEETGLKAPGTYDELYDVLSALKVEYNLSQPLYMQAEGTISNQLVSGFGVNGEQGSMSKTTPFYQVDGKVKFGRGEDGWREYLAMMNKYYTEGLISNDFMNNSGMMNADTFLSAAAGESAVFQAPYSFFDMLASTSGVEGYELIGIKDPTVNTGDTTHFSGNISRVSTTSSYSISTACDDIALACRWMNFFATKEGTMLSRWGIEGLTYDIDVNGEPYFTEFYLHNPDGISMMDMRTTYTLDICSPSSPNVLLKTSSESVQKTVATWNEGRDGAYTYPSNASMSAEEAEIFNKAWSDISTYNSEMTLKFIMGEEDINDDAAWVAYTSMLESMDIQACIDMKQAALDRYLKR